MKKYIAPNAKTILLGAEHSIMLTGSLADPNTTANGSAAMSNGRESVSSSIWGKED